MSIKRFHQFHAEQDAILASKLLPDEIELNRILSRERIDEVAAWKKSVDAIEPILKEREVYP